MTEVEVELANLERRGVKSRVILLVDSGAAYSIVSARILEGLGIRPLERRRFTLANGDKIERGVGGALLRIAGRTGFASVIFGLPSDQEVLGVTALGEVGLEFDPISRQLRPMELFLA